MDLHDFLSETPILPFIRHAKIAVRKPWSIPDRRLLDYLLMYVQEGSCIVNIPDEDIHHKVGDWCLIQPNTLHSLYGTSDTITPFIHMDIFYNLQREESFPTKPGQSNLDSYKHMFQPRLNDLTGIEVPIKFQPKQQTRFRDTLLKTIDIWNRRDAIHQLKHNLWQPS